MVLYVEDPITERTIKTAAKLGIKQYRMQWIKYDKALDMESNLEKIKKQFGALAEMNAHYKIRGDYQTHSGTSFGAPVWDLWFVLRDLDSKWLGCRYDIRHATVEGIKAWPVSLKAIAPYIRSLDIKDFYWDKEQGDKIINCPLGEGLVDFEKYVQLLKVYHVKGNFTLHFEYPLGGANSGKYEITLSPKEVIDAMKRDLKRLKGYLNA